MTATLLDKRLSEDDVVAELRSGMTIAIGGWGSRRKPMSIVRAILRSDLTDLTVLTHGGPDLGLLCAAGKVRQAVYAFASLDSIPLEPHFRRARESGAVTDRPLDEGLVHLGLQAAAWRVPFLPTRVGLGSDLGRDNPMLGTVTSPFDDREELLAMPAFRLDAAICHLNRSDPRGNAMFLGPDLYWDDLMLQAAPTGGRFISTERVVPTDDLAGEGCLHQMRISRMMVDGVVSAPGGAHFTSCAPDYGRDEAFQRAYAGSAAGPEAWDEFRAAWIDIPEADYQRKVSFPERASAMQRARPERPAAQQQEREAQ
jgi:glutaconate CoA-transferase subunit A